MAVCPPPHPPQEVFVNFGATHSLLPQLGFDLNFFPILYMYTNCYDIISGGGLGAKWRLKMCAFMKA